MRYPIRFYCMPEDRGIPPACGDLPCQGHRATRDQELVAKVLAELEGIPWWDLVQPDHRRLLRRARLLLHTMRHRQAQADDWRPR